MSRQNSLPKSSMILLMKDENGQFNPVPFSKLKFFTLVIGFAISFSVALGLAALLFFKDDILVSLMVKHHEQNMIYEDRLLKMKASLDRVTSKQLIDQDHFERKVSDIVTKQNDLEKKQAMVSSLSDRMGVKFDEPIAPQLNQNKHIRPQPIDDMPTGSIKKSEGFGNKFARIFGGESGIKAQATLNDALNTVVSSIERTQNRQVTQLESAVTHLTKQNTRFTEALSALSLPVSKEAMGGVYIPYKANEMDKFALLTLKVEQQFEIFSALRKTAKASPLARPLPLSNEITSGFGRRVDPFRSTYAMHSGIDFRGNSSDAVKATGRGEVIKAGVNGGYGNMVEIEHAFGFTTRYAHLSSIDVSEGMKVEAGQVIGRVGSTGRSTGAHLHYEIRKDDEALDPLHYIRAGALIQ